MPSPNAIRAGDEIAGISIEYVKRRRVLRLSGWHARDAVVEPVELPLRALLERLGIEPADLASPRQWLLFAGRADPPRGGAADLVATFDDEAEARQGFQQLRRASQPGPGWAELVVLDQGGRTRPVCWFGRRAPSPAGRRRELPGAPGPDASTGETVRRRRRAWRQRGGPEGGLARS